MTTGRSEPRCWAATGASMGCMSWITPDDAMANYRVALDRIAAAEEVLRLARQARADAVRQMRSARMPWAEIEENTGLSRQRLSQLLRDFPEERPADA